MQVSTCLYRGVSEKIIESTLYLSKVGEECGRMVFLYAWKLHGGGGAAQTLGIFACMETSRNWLTYLHLLGNLSKNG